MMSGAVESGIQRLSPGQDIRNPRFVTRKGAQDDPAIHEISQFDDEVGRPGIHGVDEGIEPGLGVRHPLAFHWRVDVVRVEIGNQPEADRLGDGFLCSETQGEHQSQAGAQQSAKGERHR